MDNSLIPLSQIKHTHTSWQGHTDTPVKSALMHQDEVSVPNSEGEGEEEDAKEVTVPLNKDLQVLPVHTIHHSPLANGSGIHQTHILNDGPSFVNLTSASTSDALNLDQLTEDLPSWTTIPAAPLSEPSSDGEDETRDELVPTTSQAGGAQLGAIIVSQSPPKKRKDTSLDLSPPVEHPKRNKLDAATTRERVSSETLNLDELGTAGTISVAATSTTPPCSSKPVSNVSQQLSEPALRLTDNLNATATNTAYATSFLGTAHSATSAQDSGSDDNGQDRTNISTRKISDAITYTGASLGTTTPTPATNPEVEHLEHNTEDDPLLLFGTRNVSLLPRPAPPSRAPSQPTVPSAFTPTSVNSPVPGPTSAPRLKFAGVVIPTRRKPSQNSTRHLAHGQPKDDSTSDNALLTALSSTFRQNLYASASQPYSLSLRGPGAMAAAAAVAGDIPNGIDQTSKPMHGRKTRNSATGTASANSSTPTSSATPRIPKIILTEADVDLLLDTQVAPVSTSEVRSGKEGGDEMSSFVGTEMDAGQVKRKARLDLGFVGSTLATSTSTDDSMDTDTGNGNDEDRRPASETSVGAQVIAYAYPRETRNEMFVKRLEWMFGKGNADRGSGAKPPKHHRKYARTTVNSSGNTLRSIIPYNGNASGTLSSTSGTTSRSRSPISVSVTGVVSTGVSSFGGDDMDADEKKRKNDVQLEAVVPSRAVLEKWAGTIQTLVKGKVRVGHEGMTLINQIVGEMVLAQDYVELNSLKDTGLWDNMKLLGEMSEIPFDKELELGVKAGVQGILEFWSDKYKDSMTL